MKTTKVIIFLFSIILCVSPLCAQSTYSFKKGYHGNVELGAGAVNGGIQQNFILRNYAGNKEQPEEIIRLSTVHGYSYGNGLFLGAGIGYNFALVNSAQYASLFADAKYNVKDASASPFVEGRVGYNFWGESEGDLGGMLVSLAGGVDTGRISIRVGYEYSPLKQRNRISNSSFVWCYYIMNQFFFSLAFNF